MSTYVLMDCSGENQLLFNSDIVLKLYLKHISQSRTSPKTKPNTYNHRYAVPFIIIIKTRKKDRDCNIKTSNHSPVFVDTPVRSQ